MLVLTCFNDPPLSSCFCALKIPPSPGHLVPHCMATSRPKPVEAPVTKATYAVVSTKKIWDF